jgi:uncharacterized protein (TIGR00369 family)
MMPDSIWFRPFELSTLMGLEKNTMVSELGIEFFEIGDNYLKARMPVDHRTHQPNGLLHGGASVVLAESIASAGCHFTLDTSKYNCVGLEINANHIRSVKDGWVTGMSTPIHRGKSTQIWSTEIRDEADRLVCVSRMTVAILKLNPND